MKFLSPIVTCGLPVPGQGGRVRSCWRRARGAVGARRRAVAACRVAASRARASRRDSSADRGSAVAAGRAAAECIARPGRRIASCAAMLTAPAARRASACAASSSSSSSGASGCSSAERRRDQPVGEPGVLGQQRPVQVGADHVAVRARPRARRRRCCRGPRARGRAAVRRPEVRAPAVVLESGEHAARSPGSSSTSIATLPISRGPSRADRAQVDQADARAASRRRARRSGRAADSRRRRRGSRRRGPRPRAARRA